MDERLIKYSRITIALQALTILSLLLVSWAVLFSYMKSVEARATCIDREYQGSKEIICQDYYRPQQ
ncbi:MAG: hypothetical protein ABIJ46_02040 [bacterium]